MILEHLIVPENIWQYLLSKCSNKLHWCGVSRGHRSQMKESLMDETWETRTSEVMLDYNPKYKWISMNPYRCKLVSGGEEAHFLCRRILSKLCRCSVLKKKGHKSPVFKCRLCAVTSFQRPQYGKGETRVIL